MKHKIARIILIVLIVIITCILLFACGSKPTEAEVEPLHAESYELYVLDSENKLTFYGYYTVNSGDIYCMEKNGNVITTYHTTSDTKIIFANNGVTIISPHGHKESFTQGLLRIRRE